MSKIKTGAILVLSAALAFETGVFVTYVTMLNIIQDTRKGSRRNYRHVSYRSNYDRD